MGMAANRLYYSLFHAATALFVNDGVEVGSHKGVKAKLGQYYIVTGKMSVDHSKFLAQMETLRDKADYNIMFVASEEDVLPNEKVNTNNLPYMPCKHEGNFFMFSRANIWRNQIFYLFLQTNQ